MRSPALIVCFLMVCILIGNVSAETRIMIPEGSFEDATGFPIIISGIAAATGVSFELSYDRNIIHVEDISASSEIPNSNVIPGIDNDMGYAKVAIINTDGIFATEPIPLAVVQFTRVGSGGSTVIIQDPRWSDTQFMTNTFDVALDGNVKSLEVAAPTATATSASGSRSSLPSSSGTPAPTSTPESPVTPAPGTTTPVSPGDTTRTPPAAPPDTTTGSTQSPATPKTAPGFCTGTVFASGLIGAALMLYRRS